MSQELQYTKIVKYMRRTASLAQNFDRILSTAYNEREVKKHGMIVHTSPVFHHPNFNKPIQVYFIKLEEK